VPKLNNGEPFALQIGEKLPINREEQPKMSAAEYGPTRLVVRIDPGVSELAAEAARLRQVHVDDYIQVLIDADLRGVKPCWHKA
jgi:hypothetical protein